MEFLKKPDKPRLQTLVVCVRNDGGTRAVGISGRMVPVMVCTEQCVLPLLAGGNKEWFEEVRAFPYKSLDVDMMSAKIATKLGLRI